MQQFENNTSYDTQKTMELLGKVGSYEYIKKHGKQGNLITIYNRDKSYVCFITKESNVNNNNNNNNNNIGNSDKHKKSRHNHNNNRKHRRGQRRGRGKGNTQNQRSTSKSNSANTSKIVAKSTQRNNFNLIANMIKKQGWKQYKIYCYGYVTEGNVLHILVNDVLAHQRW